ncbi:alpha-1,4-glucan--maltose-1-phosphate maltosyltransferase [Desulfohalovibrio reitneri]|uniref:alpha-1,4-glucan--maltose-1-phosphate maltosyltransferase n=1 Tax=Desulfohalovibrio reitneri TaxID=1307759 RepID=UPI0004A7836A|nr:alpha-1,4-glucan--maltose-1-phosphate maltosyltransferase [Desulfohalovibrio reitneri]
MQDGRKRVVIENVRPRVDGGRFPAKRAVGEDVAVRADVFADGHDVVRAVVAWRPVDEAEWRDEPMERQGNDVFTARFPIERQVDHEFTVRGWIDHFASWLTGLEKKVDAGQEVTVPLADGASLVMDAAGRARESGARADADALEGFATSLASFGPDEGEEGLALASDPLLGAMMVRHHHAELVKSLGEACHVAVEPALVACSAWYELFPRSCGQGTEHGTFRDVMKQLPRVKSMGFDVLYLPPIHPIGRGFRKGANNTTTAAPGEPGSPWAIGAAEGGHDAVHPRLGSLEDFRELVGAARSEGLEVAMDIAFQCSPDHPWVEAHPEWFRHRSDGTIQYAENPPKKYQDIYPLDFETPSWRELWQALRDVFLFWAGQGVRVFRVDNPHTKPLPFWEWCLGEVKKQRPETVFLSEAFTRPKIMYRLAKAGFSQSYTYFTWRNSKQEIESYMQELVETAPRDFFRPNFWPNTPDILPEYLQYGGRPAFLIRLVLAATLSSNYGIYGPAFELCENHGLDGREEYLDSEKFEIKDWDLDRPGNLTAFITRLNAIRAKTPALRQTWNVRFLPSHNDHVVFFAKWAEGEEGRRETTLTAVSLDPHNPQTAELELPLEDLGIKEGATYMVHDLLGDDKFVWAGRTNRMAFDPRVLPARVFRLRTRLRRETDFDYFM